MSALVWAPSLLLVLLSAGPIYGIYRYAKRYPPATSGPVSGVAGWLLLLVTGLIFLGPVIGTLSMIGEFGYAEYKNHNLRTSAAWGNYKTIALCIYFLIACVSFYGGLGLAKVRSVSAVHRAIIVLWVVGPVAYLFMGIFVPLFAFGTIQSKETLTNALVGSVFYSSVWTWYLYRSKRVRATYGNSREVAELSNVKAERRTGRSFRLGGWQRIGILVSVVWALVVIFYALYETKLGLSSRMLLIEMVASKTPDSIGLIWSFPRIVPSHFILACFGPIFAGWALFYLGAWAIRWVRFGFKSDAA